MEFDLPYGKSSLTVRIPDDCNVSLVAKQPMPLLPDPVSAVHDALVQPVGSPSLSQLAANAKTACILVCDITRPVPNKLFLRPIVDNLVAGGIEPEHIVILIATGLHRPNQGSELEELIGDRTVLGSVSVQNHFASRTSDHINLGTTSSGTPVLLDQRFVQADVKIATGLVEPHFMAGYSGGRKVVVPGIAHESTIRALHRSRILEDPNCKMCNVNGNPLHLEQIEILKLLRDHSETNVYALNTVIDTDRNLAFVNFGEIESSHAQAMSFAEQYCVVPLARKFATIVTSAAGYPLDQTYYQAVKGMVAPLEVLQDNGTLVLAAECGAGLGSDAYRVSQQRLLDDGPDAFLERVSSKQAADVDEWETEMQVMAQRNRHISLFSDGLVGDDRRLTGVHMLDSVEDGIEHALSRTTGRDIALIPEGPYVVPKFEALQSS